MLYRLLLGKPQGELASDPTAMPCLLQQLQEDGSRKKGPPGYQVSVRLATRSVSIRLPG